MEVDASMNQSLSASGSTTARNNRNYFILTRVHYDTLFLVVSLQNLNILVKLEGDIPHILYG